MNQATETKGKGKRRGFQIPTYVYEALLVITVTPALVHGFLSITNIPLV